MTVEIRPAAHVEVAIIHQLIEQAYRGETARTSWMHDGPLPDGQRIQAEVIHHLIDNISDALLIAVEDGSIVGCVCVTEKGNGITELGLLGVAPTSQTGGIGKALIDAAERIARERFRAGAMEMSVIAQRPKLVAYYERRGYVATERTHPYPFAVIPPLNFIVMRKSL